MSVHVCVRVYASGDAKESVRDEVGLASWLSFNRQARPGNALFVDGGCLASDQGYLTSVQADGIEALLRAEMASAPARRPVRKEAGRYPDDLPRDGFLLRAGAPATPAHRTGVLDEGWHVPDDVEIMPPGRAPPP